MLVDQGVEYLPRQVVAFKTAQSAGLNIILELTSEDWGQRHFCVEDPNGVHIDIMEATGLPSGTVYPALRRLDRDGFLSSNWEDREAALEEQRPPRRYYEVSENGQLALSDARSRFHGLERAVPEATGSTPPEGHA